MNKIALTALIVGGVAVIGGYMYFVGESNEMGQNATSQVSENKTSMPSDKKMAFSEFMKQDGSYKCTVEQSINNVDSKGTVFVHQGMVRGSFATTVSGKETISNMLMRDGYTYVWSPDMSMAMKIATPKENMNADMNAGMAGNYFWNAEEVGNYNCEKWNADQATFAIPSGITFVDPSQMGGMYTR